MQGTTSSIRKISGSFTAQYYWDEPAECSGCQCFMCSPLLTSSSYSVVVWVLSGQYILFCSNILIYSMLVSIISSALAESFPDEYSHRLYPALYKTNQRHITSRTPRIKAPNSTHTKRFIVVPILRAQGILHFQLGHRKRIHLIRIGVCTRRKFILQDPTVDRIGPIHRLE